MNKVQATVHAQELLRVAARLIVEAELWPPSPKDKSSLHNSWISALESEMYLAYAPIERVLLEEWLSEIAGPNPHYVSGAVRKRVFQRDGFTCLHCGSNDRLSIDHIHPVSKGGTSDESNLQCLCVPCNSRKGVRV